jgi:hypothetical protein
LSFFIWLHFFAFFKLCFFVTKSIIGQLP